MSDVFLHVCPDCNLMMSSCRVVERTETWTQWECWNCGHVFGGMSHLSSLDIGVIRKADR